jgi:hypothetical protein
MAQHRYIPWDSVELEHLKPLLKRLACCYHAGPKETA